MEEEQFWSKFKINTSCFSKREGKAPSLPALTIIKANLIHYLYHSFSPYLLQLSPPIGPTDPTYATPTTEYTPAPSVRHIQGGDGPPLYPPPPPGKWVAIGVYGNTVYSWYCNSFHYFCIWQTSLWEWLALCHRNKQFNMYSSYLCTCGYTLLQLLSLRSWFLMVYTLVEITFSFLYLSYTASASTPLKEHET